MPSLEPMSETTSVAGSAGHPEPLRDVARRGGAERGQALIVRIAMVLRTVGRLPERSNDVGKRRRVRVADAEADEVHPARRDLLLHPVDLGEEIGRETAYSLGRKDPYGHRPRSPLRSRRPPPRRHSREKGELFSGLSAVSQAEDVPHRVEPGRPIREPERGAERAAREALAALRPVRELEPLARRRERGRCGRRRRRRRAPRGCRSRRRCADRAPPRGRIEPAPRASCPALSRSPRRGGAPCRSARRA